MKATWIIFSVLILGITTAKAQITQNTSDSSWVLNEKLNAYTTVIKNKSISAKNLDVVVTMDGKTFPFISNGLQYSNTWTDGMTMIIIKKVDGTFPDNPGNKSFHVVVK